MNPFVYLIPLCLSSFTQSSRADDDCKRISCLILPHPSLSNNNDIGINKSKKIEEAILCILHNVFKEKKFGN